MGGENPDLKQAASLPPERNLAADPVLTMPNDVEAAIAKIYASVFEAPFATFKEDVLEALRPTLPFDSAVWGSGIWSTNVPLNISFIGQRVDGIATYTMRWQDEDLVRLAAVGNPGTAYRNEDLQSREEYHRSAIYLNFCQPHGIAQALCIVSADAAADLAELVYLFRAGEAARFSDVERAALERLMPHLTAAWQQRQRLNALENGLSGQDIESPGFAVVDEGGMIYAADRVFTERMREASPDWSGPTLPLSLIRLFSTSSGELAHAGFVARLQRGGDRHVVTLTARPPGALTPAELRAARLYAAGRTKAQIAETLGIARSTVSNQLAAVFSKLDVHDKVSLARAMDQIR